MGNWKIYELETDLQSLGVDVEKYVSEIESKAKTAMDLLHRQVYGLIVEEAEKHLKSRRKIYLENLGMLNESDRLWVVYLKKPAGWIEDGLPPHNMIQNLTSGPKSKVAKDGSRYNIIPFKYNQSPQISSRAHLQLQNLVKHELKRLKLDKPIKKDNKVVIGRAITLKNELTGPGMPVSKHGKPLLQNLTIYQKVVKTATGKDRVQRDIMTFRVASTKQLNTGLWDHPGLEKAGIFDIVSEKVDKIWNEMLQDIISSLPAGGAR